MIATAEKHMAKGRGRPAKPDAEMVKLVKLNADLVEMIGWIVRLKGGGLTAAQLVDPLLRPQITARYETFRPQVEKIKRAQAEAKTKGDREE